MDKDSKDFVVKVVSSVLMGLACTCFGIWQKSIFAGLFVALLVLAIFTVASISD